MTASDDTTARVWDVATSQSLLVLTNNGEVYDSFSPDSSPIITSSQDKTVRIWDSRTGALLWSLQPGDTVWRARFSPKPIKTIPVQSRPDGILFDPYKERVWVPHGAPQATVIDAVKGAVVRARRSTCAEF